MARIGIEARIYPLEVPEGHRHRKTPARGIGEAGREMKLKIVYIAEDGIEREEVVEFNPEKMPSWIVVNVPRMEIQCTMPKQNGKKE